MKPYGPFDAVGHVALYFKGLSDFKRGQRDFTAKRVNENETLDYLDGWLSAQVAHMKKLGVKY